MRVFDASAVPRYAGAARESTREGHRVTRCRLGDRVVLIRILEYRAVVKKPRETAVELRVEPMQIVRPHLIDREQHDQGWLGPLLLRWHGSERNRREAGDQRPPSRQYPRTRNGRSLPNAPGC